MLSEPSLDSQVPLLSGALPLPASPTSSPSLVKDKGQQAQWMLWKGGAGHRRGGAEVFHPMKRGRLSVCLSGWGDEDRGGDRLALAIADWELNPVPLDHVWYKCAVVYPFLGAAGTYRAPGCVPSTIFSDSCQAPLHRFPRNNSVSRGTTSNSSHMKTRLRTDEPVRTLQRILLTKERARRTRLPLLSAPAAGGQERGSQHVHTRRWSIGRIEIIS